MMQIHPSVRHYLIVSTLACTFAGSALAERADREKPTNIEANQMLFDESKQVNTFIGNVVVTRGTLVMHGEKLILKKDSAGYQFGTLFAPAGGIATFRQKRDGGKDLWMEGLAADRIEYDTKNEVAKLFKRSKVRMLDGPKVTDEVEGEFISYDTRTEFYTANNTVSGESKPGAGRVRATIQPREKELKGDDK
ncbi:MAG: lipopolysaccharide transport periplasmic protein LptA [Oxalobacteraceae bacterium]|jgi:lipopolysaccharide export system protein LptA|nr:lipopolysaccharide transport periplasmic protein LptA [Oxalobacteraceae bacterium]